MPPGNKTSLVAKVFHFNIEDHVAGYFLTANRRRLPIKEDFESNPNVLHFPSNGISPKGVAILLVKLKGFFGGLRQFNARFVGPFKKLWILLFHKQDNPVPLFKYVRDPPVESWFMVNANNLVIFSGLNGMRFLQIA